MLNLATAILTTSGNIFSHDNALGWEKGASLEPSKCTLFKPVLSGGRARCQKTLSDLLFINEAFIALSLKSRQIRSAERDPWLCSYRDICWPRTEDRRVEMLSESCAIK